MSEDEVQGVSDYACPFNRNARWLPLGLSAVANPTQQLDLLGEQTSKDVTMIFVNSTTWLLLQFESL